MMVSVTTAWSAAGNRDSALDLDDPAVVLVLVAPTNWLRLATVAVPSAAAAVAAGMHVGVAGDTGTGDAGEDTQSARDMTAPREAPSDTPAVPTAAELPSATGARGRDCKGVLAEEEERRCRGMGESIAGTGLGSCGTGPESPHPRTAPAPPPPPPPGPTATATDCREVAIAAAAGSTSCAHKSLTREMAAANDAVSAAGVTGSGVSEGTGEKYAAQA